MFALIVALAGRFPTAAGLMLTFPALNGLAFILSRQDTVGPITATMLWMPLLNGVLCVAYLALFVLLAAPATATALAWVLAAGVAALWLLLVTRRRIRNGVPPQLQPAYVLTVALCGIALTGLWWLFAAATGTETGEAAKPALTWLKTLLFALALWLLIVLPPRFRWKDGASGILSGMPLVALAGLLSVAQDTAVDLEVRRALLAQMMSGVWLAPAMAVGFIYSTSRLLLRPRMHHLRIAVVVGGWLLCFTAIVAIGAVLQWLAPPAAN
ncbi:MAG: hypothetical protein KF771_00865 [Burkholderiales bacterium]|nr:hypothetical protein [Burkholderiales bacterium]